MLLAATEASAQPTADEVPDSQLQLDLGLSVIAAGFEFPVAKQLALQLEVGIFGTYFLPWFERGDDVAGAVAGVRGTWFANPDGHGLYVTPYLRAGYGRGENDDGGRPGEAAMTSSATFVAVGGFVGWALALSSRIDLRIGGGLQFIYLDGAGESALGAATPFLALDLALGYRL